MSFKSITSTLLILAIVQIQLPSTHAWYLFSGDTSSSISSPSDTLSNKSLAEATKEVINNYLNGGVGAGINFAAGTAGTAGTAGGTMKNDGTSTSSSSTSSSSTTSTTSTTTPTSSPPEISFLFPALSSMIKSLPSLIKSIILYKPPVGLTSIYIFFKFFFSSSSRKNLLSIVSNDMDTTSSNDENDMKMNTRNNMRKKRIGRSLELDEDDGKMMVGLGGIEAVRTELCIAALEDYIIVDLPEEHSSMNSTKSSSNDEQSHFEQQQQQQQQQQHKNNNDDYLNSWNTLQNPQVLSYYASAVRDALQINAAPMSSREDFVEKTIEPLVKLQHYDRIRNNYHAANVRQQQQQQHQYQHKTMSMNRNKNRMRSAFNMKSSIPTVTSSMQSSSSPSSIPSHPVTTSDNSNIIDIIWMSSTVAHIRTIDALLRALRDRLVVSAMRLSRKEKYRVWRLQWYETGFGRYFKQWMRRTMKNKTVDDDRRNLQLTRAALRRELERLGQVQGLLLNRPCEMSETRLLTSVEATLNEEQGGDDTPNESSSSTSNPNKGKNTFTPLTKRKKLSAVGRIDGDAARQALYRAECNFNRRNGFRMNNINNNSSNRRGGHNNGNLNPLQEWTLEAQEWTMQGRGVISELVTETISDVFEPTSCLTRDRHSNVESDLVTLSAWASGKRSGAEDWYTVLALFDCMSLARLMREHKYLPTAIDFRYWFKRIDYFGIPSSLATIGASMIVHSTLKPFWPGIVNGAKVVGKATWGVIEFRFVAPFKDIVLDLLNRRPKLLDPFELSNEETSLDNMLRDIGIGDGTKKGRKAAVAAASRMYESEMAQGVIRNFLRGEMVRLLLIQVQQLKTGLLQAMGSIDALIDANRLNVQLLATIPAVLLVTVGTRVFFRAMYGLRSKDIVGLPTAHAEMKDLLMKMERCLLLSCHTEDNVSDGGKDIFLKLNDLGEMTLYMHSYLSILDYCSPPFPTKTCDSIHSEMQELLMQGQLSTKRQISLLKVRILVSFMSFIFCMSLPLL